MRWSELLSLHALAISPPCQSLHLPTSIVMQSLCECACVLVRVHLCVCVCVCVYAYATCIFKFEYMCDVHYVVVVNVCGCDCIFKWW